MYKHKIFLLSVVLLFASVTSGCWLWPFGGAQVVSGFKVTAKKYVQMVGGGFFFISPTTARGTWQYDNGSALGNTTSFAACCGTITVPDGRVPARWLIFAGAQFGNECIGQLTNPNMDVDPGQNRTANCLVAGIFFPFAMSPATFNLQSPPATMELTGSNLNTTYGLPRIEYMDPYSGDLLAITTATSVSGDGTWLQATTPDLSAVYSGTFSVIISNKLSDGRYEVVGTSTVDAYGRDFTFEEPPPPGECGCPPTGPCIECGPVS